MPEQEINMTFKTDGLDQAIEKANQLIALLREAANLIDSLSGKRD